MSLTNAISAIAVVGSIVVTGADHPLTIRILARWRSRLDDEHRQRLHDHRPHAQDVQKTVMHLIGELSAVLATALFIFALYWMNDPKTARRSGDRWSHGMTVAVLATWIQPESSIMAGSSAP